MKRYDFDISGSAKSFYVYDGTQTVAIIRRDVSLLKQQVGRRKFSLWAEESSINNLIDALVNNKFTIVNKVFRSRADELCNPYNEVFYYKIVRRLQYDGGEISLPTSYYLINNIVWEKSHIHLNSIIFSPIRMAKEIKNNNINYTYFKTI